jgi:hypothetical protein
MNSFAKLAAAAACAAAMSLPLAAPAAAGDADDPIVVSSVKQMQEWQKDTTRELDHALARAPLGRTFLPNNAVVEVAFTLGADGRAANIEVLDGKGNQAARWAAKYAVRSLDGLDEVPVTNRKNARFLASIIFADDKADHRRLVAQRDARRAAYLASTDPEGRTILLGG